jgi:DNA recombination protein Rad52
MPFTDTQVKALSAKLSGKHVRSRQANGKALSYIEGWHAIAEANRIFGFDGWERRTLDVKCVWENSRQGHHACSYIARVRVRVRAGEVPVIREGCGAGHGAGPTLGESHESAIKEAETDAMKRALVTFGNPFGLALYDREQRGVRGAPTTGGHRALARSVAWVLLSAEGEPVSLHDDPVDYCKTVRQQIEAASTQDRLEAFWSRNQVTVEMLRQTLDDLKTEKGEHYADILHNLYDKHLREFQATTDDGKAEQNLTNRKPSGDSGRIDKSALSIGEVPRRRSKEHLRFVATQPCLVCGRQPSQAHHLRFAQARALGRKVSDEWVVPLCAVHHRSLHTVGDEQKWWKSQNIDPINSAEILWRERNGKNNVSDI